jgi:hypothetical protein
MNPSFKRRDGRVVPGWVGGIGPAVSQMRRSSSEPRSALMPSVSNRQRRFLGADLARKRAGKKTKTGMSEQELREFASKPVKKRKKKVKQ